MSQGMIKVRRNVTTKTLHIGALNIQLVQGCVIDGFLG